MTTSVRTLIDWTPIQGVWTYWSIQMQRRYQSIFKFTARSASCLFELCKKCKWSFTRNCGDQNLSYGKISYRARSNRFWIRGYIHLRKTMQSIKDSSTNYFGTDFRIKQWCFSLEIRRRITLANRRYFGLSKQLSKKALSWRTKICLYKSPILPVLLYGADTWALTSSD